MPDEQSVDQEPDRDDAAWEAWSHQAGARARARRSLRLSVVLAALIAITAVAVAVIVVVLNDNSGTSAKDSAATQQVVSAHQSLVAQRKMCPAGDGQLDCRRNVAGALSLAYRDFSVDLDRIDIPAADGDARDTVEEDAQLLSNAYDELSVAATNSAYDRTFARDGVDGLQASFERHYAALVAAMRAS